MSDNTLTRENQFYAEIARLRAEVARLRTQLEMWQDGNIMADSHRDEFALLKAERDEARRISCASSAELRYIDQPDDITLDFHARRIATERGWDCYKGEGQ